MAAISSKSPGFILASGSPRRRELTAALGWEPIVLPSSVEEVRASHESPKQYTERLASDKARAVIAAQAGREDLPEWVLSADTIVVQDGEVLEKPLDEEDAVRMLVALSGSTHEVITSFCWASRESNEQLVRSVTTVVHFRELDLDTIRRYVATGEPMDKAGAYGIQGLGGVFVASIEGSFSAVVGLPVAAVVEALERLGGLEGFPFVPA